MKKAMMILMLSASGAMGQNIAEITINVPEGRVAIKGDIVKVYWRADGVSRCYNLKSRALVGC